MINMTVRLPSKKKLCYLCGLYNRRFNNIGLCDTGWAYLRRVR